jgi:hypothetical protein
MVRVRTVVAWLFLASLTGLIEATAASASVEVQKQWIGAPEFSGPEGIASDVSVVDQGNDRVLKFDPQGALARSGDLPVLATGSSTDPSPSQLISLAMCSSLISPTTAYRSSTLRAPSSRSGVHPERATGSSTDPSPAHMFRVRATDKAGNTDPTPAKRSFKVVR